LKLKDGILVSLFSSSIMVLMFVGYVNANYPGNHCLTFDGVDDYVSCASPVYEARELTVELWIQPKYTIESGSQTRYGQALGAIIGYTETWASQGGWALYFNFSDGRLYFTYRWAGPYQGHNTKTVCTNRAVWSSGSWYHVAATYSPATFSLVFYVNKTIDRTYTWTNIQDVVYESASLKIGGDLTYGYMFQGLIDEVRLWNVTKTQSEVSGSWNRVLNLTECAKPELIGYWHFDEEFGLESEDYSIQGNNAVLGLVPYDPKWVDLGAPIIPEFPSLLVLQLFLIATLLAAVVYRRKRCT